MPNAISIKSWWFESSSSSQTHETQLWSDNSLTCGCPGWCKRVSDGVRTCKHVRMVLAGIADQQAKAVKVYDAARLLAMGNYRDIEPEERTKDGRGQSNTPPETKPPGNGPETRKFNFD